MTGTADHHDQTDAVAPEGRIETYEQPAPGTPAAGWPYAGDADAAAALRNPALNGV